MSGYHGISYRDAARWLHVHERTVRMWFTRYPQLSHARTGDGRINLQALTQWYDDERDQDQARRRGNAGIPVPPKEAKRAS